MPTCRLCRLPSWKNSTYFFFSVNFRSASGRRDIATPHLPPLSSCPGQSLIFPLASSRFYIREKKTPSGHQGKAPLNIFLTYTVRSSSISIVRTRTLISCRWKSFREDGYSARFPHFHYSARIVKYASGANTVSIEKFPRL